ncbi:hypothetical protein CEP52_011453 [Fusarium oligoseptatum]|uniref:Uncharacterized protein n=1 Tax=Fusarium oligoseptatum TaxID=2604345 RepID=A0A428T3C5_9HYPO|nr:hypothetical protein CEP52_011453 [Fusarium oligoseptatum]
MTTPSPCQQSDISQSPCETDLLWNTFSPASPKPQHSPKGYMGDEIFVERNPQLHGANAALWTTRVARSTGYEPSPFVLRYPNFVPYVRIYLERLYSVFPVVDREFLSSLLNPESQDGHIPVWLYAFLSALSAAVIVQLNVTDIKASDMSMPIDNEHPNRTCVRESIPGFSPQLFISQCMQARQQHAFIEEADEWTILTSFFLFVAHDNLNQPKSASYYLREAIGFGSDASGSFWLLFVTERAYAIQHRRRAILRPTIDPPRIFECRDPKLAYGFASLVKVFATIDEPFIAARMNEQTSHDVDLSPHANQSIARLLDHSTIGGVLSMSEIDETQRLDITVTQHWIRILACQLRMASSLRPNSSKTQFTGSLESYIQRVLDTSKSLLRLISTATPASLECHGLGMERKIADAANCLCDVIANVDVEDFAGFFTAPEYLHSFMMFLSDFRNRESQCLQPLAQRATIILAARLDPMNSLGALGEEAGPPRRRDSEQWINLTRQETSTHREVLAHLLQTAVVSKKLGEIRPEFVNGLCQIITWESMVNPRVKLGPWFWEALRSCSHLRPHVRRQEDLPSSEVGVHAVASLYLREPERYLDQLKDIYSLIQKDQLKIRRVIEQWTKATDIDTMLRVSSQFGYRFGYGLMLSLGPRINRCLRRFDKDPALVLESYEFCDQAIVLGRQCLRVRPFWSWVCPYLSEECLGVNSR